MLGTGTIAAVLSLLQDFILISLAAKMMWAIMAGAKVRMLFPHRPRSCCVMAGRRQAERDVILSRDKDRV